jgi:hypothetical protein
MELSKNRQQSRMFIHDCWKIFQEDLIIGQVSIQGKYVSVFHLDQMSEQAGVCQELICYNDFDFCCVFIFWKKCVRQVDI